MHLTTINKTLSVAVVSSYLYRVAVSANNSTIIQNARTLAECTLEKQKTRMATAVGIGGKTELKIRDSAKLRRGFLVTEYMHSSGFESLIQHK